MLLVRQQAAHLTVRRLRDLVQDIPALDRVDDYIPLEEDVAPVVARVCRDLLYLAPALIDLLLDGRAVDLRVCIVARIDDFLLDRAQDVDLVLDAAFRKIQHICALADIVMVLPERTDTDAHLFRDRILRRAIPGGVDLHPARDFMQLFR